MRDHGLSYVRLVYVLGCRRNVQPEPGLLVDEAVVRAVRDGLQIVHSVQQCGLFHGAPIGNVATDRCELECFLRAVQLQEERRVGGVTLPSRPGDQVEAFTDPSTWKIVQQTQVRVRRRRRGGHPQEVMLLVKRRSSHRAKLLVL